MLPNFLIIGAPRSATTFLSRCASDHPEVYVATPGKYGTGDVHFFDVSTEVSYRRNFEKGIGWYEGLFAGATNQKAVGEKTATYLCDPQAPALIRQHLPDVRMIAILRNPVDRAYSDYQYSMGQIPGNLSFLEACFSERTKRHKLLEAGYYYEHIMRYLEYFGRSQFLFLIYDDLEADPLLTVQDVFAFLDVDTAFVPSCYDQRINVSLPQQHLSRRLRRLGGSVKARFPRLFVIARRLAITRLVEKKIDQDSRVDAGVHLYPSPPAEDAAELSKVYYEQNRRLSDLLNRDLVGLWRQRHPRQSG